MQELAQERGLGRPVELVQRELMKWEPVQQALVQWESAQGRQVQPKLVQRGLVQREPVRVLQQ